jgi:phosphoribosyl 1,2-cyclic phosphodiesterase
MSPVVFPVTFEELDATIDFRGLPEGTPTVGSGYEVTAFGVQHPGGALGYRFSAPGGNGGALVYVSDNELAPHPRYDSSADWRNRMASFVHGAAVLIHDTTYTTAEYEYHKGWGHSTYAEAVELAIEASVGTLVLFHHEPRRSDDQLERCLAECQQMVKDRGASLSVVLAAEGLTLTL